MKWILSVSDVECAAEWLLTRIELGLVDHTQVRGLKHLLNVAHAEMERELGPMYKQFQFSDATQDKIRREQRKAEEEAWLQRKEQLIKREIERRRGSDRQYLEAQLKKPAAKETRERKAKPNSAADRMSKAWSRRYMQQRRSAHQILAEVCA